MSLSWRRALRVAVAPHGAALLVRGGFRGKLVHHALWDAPPAAPGERPWEPVVEALRKNLAPRFYGASRTSVTLSSHFCRYALVPSRAGLERAAEIRAYVQAKLKTQFGEVASDWDVQIDAYRDALLVCAVDRALLDALRTLFADVQVPVESLQPYFGRAFNRARRRVGANSGWFVVHERGLVVMSRFEAGRWTCLTSRRTPGDGPDALAATLEREQRLQLRPREENEAVWLTSAVARYGASDFAPFGYEVGTFAPALPQALQTEAGLDYAMAW